MSHAETADRLLIKPAAGAIPEPPHTRGRFIPKARTRRPFTRRVTRGTATTRLAMGPDRPTRRVLPSPDGTCGGSSDVTQEMAPRLGHLAGMLGLVVVVLVSPASMGSSASAALKAPRSR